jgi:hypothetical protein
VKCLNPACGSVAADELNVSVNVSETERSEEMEYVGSTEMGDTSNTVGTICPDCEMTVFVHDWKAVMVEWLGPRQDLDWVMVLPEPRWCWLHLEQGERVHADYTDKYASRWDISALMCEQHALAHALKGEPIILWTEAGE